MQVHGISHVRVAAIAAQDSTKEPSRWLDRPCLGTEDELWFGPADGVESLVERRARVDVAKALCAECPFTEVCLASELARPVHDQHGVRGGLTACERKAVIRRGGLVDSGVAA